MTLYRYDDQDGQPTLEIYDADLWIILTIFTQMKPDRLAAISNALAAIGTLTDPDNPAQLVARFDQNSPPLH